MKSISSVVIPTYKKKVQIVVVVVLVLGKDAQTIRVVSRYLLSDCARPAAAHVGPAGTLW